MVAGIANLAYDAGKVFVLSSPFANAATLEAFNAQTGKQLWSTLLAGQYSFTAGVTAANGYVYTGGAGSGGTLYAVDQTNGTIASDINGPKWRQQHTSGNCRRCVRDLPMLDLRLSARDR